MQAGILDLPIPEGWKAELTLVFVICRDGLPVSITNPSSNHLIGPGGSRTHDLLIVRPVS